jgi:REP element-mobilizing transposase RayT
MRERQEMLQDPYVLDPAARAVVLTTIQGHCAYRGWKLLAAHVRTNHVHVVLESEIRPERVMNELKAYASRQLNRQGSDGPERKRWARHGSTRWLWKDEDVRNAVRYVIDEQGDPMAVFLTEGW